ncbi:MAG TPA: hypothetical protein VNO30_02275 [Kofleriaceae bacterium]|nr:hypothetical protein [Kofleriaceae bacterium]
MTRSGRRHYTTGTRRQVTAEWIGRVKAALEARQRGPRWLEQEAGLAKGAATKILDGSQQTSNHVDAINQVLGLAPADLTVDSADERELLAVFRAISPVAKGHLLGLMAELRKPRG